MDKITLAAAQNSASPALKLPRGQHAVVALVTDHGNGAGAVIVLEVSADDGVNFVSVALVDQTSTTFAGTASLTGPDKAGRAVLDGYDGVSWRVRRTDATGGTPTVYVGITVPTV